ncbi:MAG: helix-turn-helix transcriptional regulator [Bryobacterales bacterium]|nr:helix-turn-helix transcriptional regulator [Bryobacterales bacterium]
MVALELFQLLDTTGDAAFAFDPQGSICYWSRNAEKLLGFSQQQILSRSCADILAGEDDAGCAICTHDCHILTMAIKGGQIPSFDLHVATVSGKRKWLNLTTVVAHLKRGASPLVVHLMRDVDRQKRVAAVTRNALNQIQQLTENQDDPLQTQGLSQHPPVDLTPRELSVLRQLSLGRNTTEIADQLYISTTTVRNHIQHILSKLHCHTRLAAVLRAVRHRLI